MRSSLLAFATDLLDEGLETVAENVQHRAGADGVTLAAAYHAQHLPTFWIVVLLGGLVSGLIGLPVILVLHDALATRLRRLRA